MNKWLDICAVQDVDLEDIITVERDGKKFAIYRSLEGEVFCTDGLCTHENVDLADGLVSGHTIECPKHNGLFNYRTGEALGAPVCENLRTYEVRISNHRVEILIIKEN